MLNINRQELAGNVGNRPEVIVENNTKRIEIDLATHERYKDKHGERKINTSWHKLVFYGKAVEPLSKYVRKGTSLYVVGKSQTETIEVDGKKYFTSYVLCDHFQFTDKKE